MADHDQLTGLFNRRRFDEELKRELARAGRYAEQSAVLSIDIDNFKGINDSAGHAAGDAVLVPRGRACCAERSRASDVVARLGRRRVRGAPLGGRRARGAQRAAEHLLAEIRNIAGASTAAGRSGSPPASAWPRSSHDDATAGEVLVNADLAMYAAKTSGRDRVVVYTPTEAPQGARDGEADVVAADPATRSSTTGSCSTCSRSSSSPPGRIQHGELLLRMKGEPRQADRARARSCPPPSGSA